MPPRARKPPPLPPEGPRHDLHLPLIQKHVAAGLAGLAHGWAIELARRLQHAPVTDRAKLVQELAAQDAWAWRARTRSPRTVAAREKAIWRALDEAAVERPIQDETTRRWRRRRPVDLHPHRWHSWFRRRVQTLLRHKE
jgi:hypothetical protein